MEENYLTKDGRRFSPIGFYPDMERAWCSFLGCAPTKEAIAAKIAEWNALDLETACNARGLVGGMVRTIEEWANTECGQQLAQTPVIEITKIGDSKPEPFAPGAARPLSGLRVVSNTHEIAGTAIGRTLAEQGADVIQTTSPDEFFHDHIFLEAGVGLRQAYVDIKKPAELAVMNNLVKDADVFAENFRHMGEHGLSPETVAAKRPGIVYVSAHGVTHHGAWAGRGAFDPLSLPMTGICALGRDAGRSEVSALRLVERCHQRHLWSARRLRRAHSQGEGRRQLSCEGLSLPLLDVVRHPGLFRQGRHQTRRRAAQAD